MKELNENRVRNRWGYAGKWAVALCGLLCCFMGGLAYATPSTEYWTPCIIDIQPYGVGHIGYDSYTTVGNKGAKKGSLPNDYGLTYGILPFKQLQAEVGVDALEPADDPLYFNAKVGSPENTLFDNSPALEVGIFNVGTKKNVTNYNILDFITGKTLPLNLGRVHLGYYYGNKKVLVSGAGKKENTGAMFGYDYGFYPVKDEKGQSYNKLIFAADWATGKNAIGGGGVGLYYYFTPAISLLTGPVWFNDKVINGRMKWTLQLDVNF
jgi:hypothetical protein